MRQACQTATMHSSYRFQVRDFGPIERASIDVRPLTIFVGPSNTGKSYLAILLYALHRSLNSPRRLRRGRLGLVRRPFRITDDKEVSESIQKELVSWASTATKPRNGPKTNQLAPPMPDVVEREIRRAMEEASGFGIQLAKEVGRCLGVEDVGVLKRLHSQSQSPQWGLSTSDAGQGLFRFRAFLDSAHPRVTGKFKGGFEIERSNLHQLVESCSYYNTEDEGNKTKLTLALD